MGSSPANHVKRETKWGAQVNYKANGHRTAGMVKGLDAPTISEVQKALYKQCPFNEYTEIEITNKWSYTE
jgi:hypothetical protein